MRIHHFPLLAAVAFGVAGCDDEAVEPEERAQGGVEWTEREQIYQQDGAATEARAEVGPTQRLAEFFQALSDNNPQAAAALVATKPLDVPPQELAESLKQWSGQIAQQQDFEILDSRQAGDFALVRARMVAPGDSSGQAQVRPVVMFQEEGEWKVVWELIGMEPDRVADVDAGTAQRLEPLYDWYRQTEVYGSEQRPGEAAQGEPVEPSPGRESPGQAAWSGQSG